MEYWSNGSLSQGVIESLSELLSYSVIESISNLLNQLIVLNVLNLLDQPGRPMRQAPSLVLSAFLLSTTFRSIRTRLWAYSPVPTGVK